MVGNTTTGTNNRRVRIPYIKKTPQKNNNQSPSPSSNNANKSTNVQKTINQSKTINSASNNVQKSITQSINSASNVVQKSITLSDTQPTTSIQNSVPSIINSPKKQNDYEKAAATNKQKIADVYKFKPNTSNVSRAPRTPAPNDNYGLLNPQRLANIYRAKVINAHRNRNIFTVYGNFVTVRRALLDRGWLEKLPPNSKKLQDVDYFSNDFLLKLANEGNDYEAVYLSRLMNSYPAYFVWQPKNYADRYQDATPYRNHVRRNANLDFSTKIGLIGCAEQEHWFKFCGLCGMSYPRFYRLKDQEERSEFIEDFRSTQCRNLVRYVIENISTPSKLLDEKNGRMLPKDLLTYAINYMERQLCDWDFLALDMEQDEGKKFNYNEWKDFLAKSTSILQGVSKFKASKEDLTEFAVIAKEYLNIIEERRPDYKWDGVRNLWILKPGNMCRGVGIVIKKFLDEILLWATNHSGNNYIVQKYIERPLLIYNCKFDIRQYMLLTIGKTMASIWLYKDCYLRFSSQNFDINDLRESIHLTNNAVQKRYKILKSRDSRLPQNNMWSLEQFKNYLESKKVPPNTWSDKVYAGFRENLIAIVLASFEETTFQENTFELYGCDFMLDEEYNPIILEINSSPDLSGSTEVTRRICPMVLADVVKVVVDVPKNPIASTGLFELAYQIDYKSIQDFDPKEGLNISGKAMTIHQEEEKEIEKEVKQQETRRFFKKLISKRLQLIKLLTCLKGSNDSEEEEEAKPAQTEKK